MALGANQLVALRPLGIGRIDPHLTAVKDGQDIRNTQSAADVTGADGVDRLHRGHTDPNRKGFQFPNLCFFHIVFPLFQLSQSPAPCRSALTTGSSSPLRKRIRAPPPVQI